MHTRTTLGLLGLIALSGCQSRLTGNLGNLTFQYTADDDVTNFNKPIAVGAFLDVTVLEVGTNQPVALTSAAFDDTSVLDVASFSGSVLTAQGIGDGGALLQVEATTASGEDTNDEINMLASTPEVLSLAHTCTTGDSAAYLEGQRVWVPFELSMENGQPVIGYGYYPVSLDGDGATLDVEDGTQQFMALDTTAAGSLVLNSEIDDTSLAMEVVEAGSIDGIEEPVAGVIEDIDAGDTNPFYVRPMVGERVVCQGDTPKTVASLTPEICEVRDTEPTDPDDPEFGWFEIEGVVEGTCQFTVTFTEGAAGAGVTETFEYPIEP